MKTTKILFNPFAYFEERRLLFTGISCFVILNLLCILFKSPMDGIMHFRITESASALQILLQNIFIITSAILVFYLLGISFNKKTRFIDICNVILVSLLPSVFILLLSSFPFYRKATLKLLESSPMPLTWDPDILIVLFFGCLLLPFVAYSFILFFQGFKTATHMKSWQKIALFFVVLIFLNVITQTLIS